MTGRLSTFAAAMVIARRDFGAILFSRSFLFFLLGPLFPVLVGAMAGGVGQRVQESAAQPELGIAMQAADVDAMQAARAALLPRLGSAFPEFKVVKRLEPAEKFEAARALERGSASVAAIVTGTPEAPTLTGASQRIAQWQGPVSLIAAEAIGRGPVEYPPVALSPLSQSTSSNRGDRLLTAQGAQTLLFLLTMLLAGMVLSNLVEEKANKIIEILAAAIPMDAVFFGKLFAMLAVSFVGITVWGVAGAALFMAAGSAFPNLPPPAVGWPIFLALGIIYFAAAYLLLGSVFLAIGSLATTVREVQTLSMPVTMMQLMVFFLASYAMTQPGSAVELGAVVFPFSSPFAMLARAAQNPTLWPHAAAIVWQTLCVIVFVRVGARLFRTRVMKSGPAKVKAGKRGFFARLRPSAA
ncbi:MAG: ABC transporter permease [Sphingomonadaceae bacterium]|nr:ABC transporter permease [Sphingomonadaceae bacterium]